MSHRHYGAVWEPFGSCYWLPVSRCFSFGSMEARGVNWSRSSYSLGGKGGKAQLQARHWQDDPMCSDISVLWNSPSPWPCVNWSITYQQGSGSKQDSEPKTYPQDMHPGGTCLRNTLIQSSHAPYPERRGDNVGSMKPRQDDGHQNSCSPSLYFYSGPPMPRLLPARPSQLSFAFSGTFLRSGMGFCL